MDDGLSAWMCGSDGIHDMAFSSLSTSMIRGVFVFVFVFRFSISEHTNTHRDLQDETLPSAVILHQMMISCAECLYQWLSCLFGVFSDGPPIKRRFDCSCAVAESKRYAID